MKKALKIAGYIFKGILILLVALFLVYDICVLVQKYAYKRDLPVFFGYTSAVIASDSMYPEICKGDLVIVDINAEYGVGDVVTYYDSSSGVYVTHRIVSENLQGGYITRGDNNDSVDLITVTDDIIVGKVVSVVGGIGTVISFIQQPYGMVIVIVIIALIWLLFYLLSKLITDRDKKE